MVQRQQRSSPNHADGGFDKQRKRPQQRDRNGAGVSLAIQQRQAGRDRCRQARQRKCGDQDHHSAKPLNLPNEASHIPSAVIEHGQYQIGDRQVDDAKCPLHGVGGNRKHRKLDTLVIAGQDQKQNLAAGQGRRTFIDNRNQAVALRRVRHSRRQR